MKLSHRQFLHLGAAALSGILLVAKAQAYPTRPMRVLSHLFRRPCYGEALPIATQQRTST
jgi:hypothetical protein